ncbi:MAG: hypothetical protein ACI35O_16885 [Bacillaceae bacterium]
MRHGFRYIGSPALLTSKKDTEVVPEKPSEWTIPYTLYNFEFENDQDCTVTINNKHSIFLRAGRGFIIGDNDEPITSFVIKEPNITYTWAAKY